MKIIVRDNNSKERSITKRLGEVKEFFDGEFNQWMTRYQEAVEQALNPEMEIAHNHLVRIAPLRKTVKEVFPEQATYQVSSWLIKEVYEYVTELPEEAVCFVAGQKLKDGSYTLEKMLRLKHKRRTRSGAKGDVNSVAKALLKIDQFGANFTAHLHSHPFKGPEGTQPSGTDLSFQERLERGGYICLGGIFSRSGFLRFFSLNNEFQIKLSGKGVINCEDNLFQIADESQG